MGETRRSIHCGYCDRRTLHEKEQLSNGMGCLLTILSCGWFIPLWLFYSVLVLPFRPYRCTQCGSGASSGRGLVLLAGGLGLLTFLFVIPNIGGDNSSGVAPDEPPDEPVAANEPKPLERIPKAPGPDGGNDARRPAEPDAVAFDIPVLVGKSIDELRESLGRPKGQTEPSNLQLSLGTDKWSNSFNSAGQKMVVTFNPKSRRVIDFFLSGTNTTLLMNRANITGNSPKLTVTPVKSLRDPSAITGIRIREAEEVEHNPQRHTSDSNAKDSLSTDAVEPADKEAQKDLERFQKVARSRLTLTRQAISSGKVGSLQIKWMKEIIKKAPDSDEAKEATELLKKLE